MKKTLLVTIDFAPQTGGVANFLVNLAPRLPAEKLLVLAPKVKNNDVDQNFNFKIFRRRLFWPIWPNWLPMIWQVMNLVKKYKIEKLWAAQPLPVGTVVLMVSKYLDIPYIINAHGMDIAGPMNSGGRRLNLLKKVLFNAQNITVNSEYTRSLILKLGIAKDRIEKIYPCSNISAQSTVLSPQLIIDKYNLRDKKVLLSVGRLVARKGYDTVIKALPVVLKKVPDLVYIIVGDGEYKRNLLELVKSLNLAQNVILTGFIPNQELPAYFDASDAFIMVSREEAMGDIEGFGMVFLEAGQYGLPVIAGNSGGQAEAVINDKTGLVVDSSNEQKVAEAIIKLLTDQNLAKNMGQRGKERVEKDFRWEVEAEKIQKILN